MQHGRVSNIQRYSLQDGPGIRTTVFLKGCPLSCAWCHNPENIAPGPEIVMMASRCARCGRCVEVCPQHRPAGAPDSTPDDRLACSLCGACVEACPSGARELVGREITVDELLSKLLRDRIFYEDSKGGVTVSGGEPLMQFEFVRDLLVACRSVGLHTALDTCGQAPTERVLEAAAAADLVLYDLKLMDEERHREFCGVSNRLILENLQRLAETHAALWLRVPLIPGVNDQPQELRAIAELVRRLPGVRQVNLLPYHRGGIEKSVRVGQQYRLTEIHPPSVEELEEAAGWFRRSGVRVKVGG